MRGQRRRPPEPPAEAVSTVRPFSPAELEAINELWEAEAAYRRAYEHVENIMQREGARRRLRVLACATPPQ